MICVLSFGGGGREGEGGGGGCSLGNILPDDFIFVLRMQYS